MSVNTFVWSYNYLHQWGKVIETLEDNKVIDPKCGFLRKYGLSQDGRVSRLWSLPDSFLKERNIFDASLFQSEEWTQKYKEKAIKYSDSVEFDQAVYDKVYEKLYLFIDHYSRHDRNNPLRSTHHYINQFNLLYHFFYGIFVKEQIQLVLFDHMPHLGAELIAYEIAKALNVKTIMLYPSLTPNKFFYLDRVDDFGDFRFMTKQGEVQKIELGRKPFSEFSSPHYVRKFKQYRFPLWKAIVRSFAKPHRFFEHFAFNYLRYLQAGKYRKNISEMVRPVDYGKKYVYFPLHLQPEVSTSMWGGIFCDQVLALELLSKTIPEGWMIYVKENPIQKEVMRDDAFFARLKLIANLQMVPLEENTFKLIEHSQFVATITGTAGWEAIRGGKPALIFGKAWYQNFDGVFQWHSGININEITNYRIDPVKLENDYNQLVSKMATGVVDSEFACLVEDYDEDKNIQGIASFLTKLINEMSEEIILPYPTKKST